MENAEIVKLLSVSESELLQSLGLEVIDKRALPPSKQELETEGRGWIKTHWDELVSAVCRSKVVQAILTMSPSQDREVQLVAAIADLISGMSLGVTPWTISVLLVQTGVDKLCPDHEKHD